LGKEGWFGEGFGGYGRVLEIEIPWGKRTSNGNGDFFFGYSGLLKLTSGGLGGGVMGKKVGKLWGMFFFLVLVGGGLVVCRRVEVR